MTPMNESTYSPEAEAARIEQPWGTLVGMFAACLIILWCVAHDYPIDEILSRTLTGGMVTAVIIRGLTFSWTVFFPKE